MVGQHELAQPPLKGQAIKQLYPGRQDYLADLTELTEAQLNRRLEARLRKGYDRATFVAQRAFHHAVFYGILTAALREGRAPSLEPWREIAALDTDNLRQVLTTMAPQATHNRKQQHTTLRGDLVLATTILRGSSTSPRHLAQLARATEALSRLSFDD